MKHIALSLIVLAAASTADAKPKPKPPQGVKVHLERAEKAHKAGNFQAALTELQAAYALDAQPKLLYAIAQVYSKLDQCSEAIDHYEKFLAADKSKEAVVRQAIDACKKRLADKPDKPDKGDSVFRTSKPPEDQLPTADKPPEPLPAAIESKPVEQQPVEQQPVEQAPPPPPRPAEPPPPAIVTEPSITATTQTTYSPWYRDILGDALVIGGVGATIGSVFTYRAAKSDIDKADAAETLDAYNDLRSSAERKQLFTIALAGGGLALVTAGVLRFTLRNNGRETPGVAIVPSAGGGLITWSGGF